MLNMITTITHFKHYNRKHSKMQIQPLSPYQQQIKEAKGIITKINNRYYENLQLQRSEGSQTVRDLKEELRQHYNQHSYGNRIRAMTQQFKKTLKASTFKRRKSSPDHRVNFLEQQFHLVQSKIVLKDRKQSRKMSQFKKQQLAEVVREVRQSIDRDSQHQSSTEQQQYEKSTFSGVPCPKSSPQYKENKTFLPMLEMYIEQRLYLKNMSKQQQRTHSIITQMLMLALARKNNNKMLDALDILIQIDSFFPKQVVQLRHLQSVWYIFIAQLYLQLKAQDRSHRTYKHQPRGTSMKTSLYRRKQQTIIIRSLVSRRNFINRVSLTIKKLELIHETTYLQQIKDSSNIIEETQNGKLVISRITQTYMLSYPEPAYLFPERQNIVNYGIVRIARDKESNYFPPQYPTSLEKIIKPEEYMNYICKINSILVPEKKCINYRTSLSINFQSILTISCLLALSSILTIVLIRSYIKISFLMTMSFLFLLGICLFCWKIDKTQATGYGQSNETYQRLSSVMQRWSDQYKDKQFMFKISEHSDIILISFPRDKDDQDFNSEDNPQSIRKGTFSQNRSDLLRRSMSLSLKDSKYLHSLSQIIDGEQSQLSIKDQPDGPQQQSSEKQHKSQEKSDRIIESDSEYESTLGVVPKQNLLVSSDQENYQAEGN